MPELALAEETSLSQGERVVDTFVAPSRTFTDVLRSAAWWLPFVLIMLSSYTLTAAIQTKVGWHQLVENEIHTNPKLMEQMASLPADQVAARERIIQVSMQSGFYAAPLFNLGFVALSALVLWMTINFGFAGSSTFGRLFCVGMYSALPGAISALLTAAMLFAGRSAETFNTKSMLGSNPGYYLEGSGALKTLLSSLDIFTIWTLVLLAIGTAIVARTKRSAGYIAVFGWFALIVAVRTAVAALQS